MCVNEQKVMSNRKPSQSWDNLRYFLAVARTGTLSAAAEQLGTEHTTVARHIHALEEAEARSGYCYRPVAAGAHARRLQSPHRLSNVCLRLAGLSGEGNADRHNAGSQEPPLHRLCRRAVVRA